MEKYGLNSRFDFKKHKETFIDYLEVLILENGEIVYAVPSHQSKAEIIASKKLNVTVDEILSMCPRKYYADYLSWLLTLTNSVCVWNTNYISGFNGINCAQVKTLKKLKLYGLYKGVVNEKKPKILV